MAEQYIVRRTKKGRYSDKGFTIDGGDVNKFVEDINVAYTHWAWKMFFMGIVMGFVIGLFF